MENEKIEKWKAFYNKDQRIKKSYIPNNVLLILKKLKESGFLSLLAGGCVRDLLLKRTVRDWDIITDASPKQIKMIFSEDKTLIIGKGFQTVTIVSNHKTYQISTFRNSSKQKLQKEQDDLFQKLKYDLIHRDFTINAMAWNQDKGLFDPVNGLRDLTQKVLQSIDPDVRFKEDPLRMLRAIRIVCELDFVMSPEIKISIPKHAFLIQNVSSERIREEICLILNSPDAKRGIFLLQKFGLQGYIFSLDRIKKTDITKKKIMKKTLSGLDILKKDLNAQLALWGRLYFGSCQTAHIFYFPVLKCLRFEKKITETVKILLSEEWQDIDFSSGVKIRFLFARFGKKNAQRMMFLKKTVILAEHDEQQGNQLKKEEILLEEELKRNHPVRLSEIAIDGNDLKKIGYQQGEEIGNALRYILKKVLVQPKLNHREILLILARDAKKYFL